MRCSKAALRLLLLVLFAFSVSSAKAQVVLDYSADLANQNFFGNNPVARAALEAAVADVNRVIEPNFNAITNDVTVGTSGGGSTRLEFDFSYSYLNPATGVRETIADTRMPENEVRIFVGAQNLSGSILGQGGSGGVGFALSGFVGGGSLQDAVADAERNAQHRRGGGPLIASLNGDVNGVDYSFGVGPTIGNLWFDQDTNNDGIADDTATLEANWHFDHTTDVAAGKSDFYSVALHETLHALGFGGSESWNALVNGTEFLGEDFIEINGTGLNAVAGDGAHLASGLQGRSLVTGELQEVVMSPSIRRGTRKHLTDLDVAAMSDFGFQSITAIPEPGSMAVLLVIGSTVFAGRRRRA